MDDKIKTMMDMEMLSPENAAHTQRLKEILDCFEQETEYDRTTVFKSILTAMNEADEDKRTIELMVYLAERMLEKAFSGELEVD